MFATFTELFATFIEFHSALNSALWHQGPGFCAQAVAARRGLRSRKISQILCILSKPQGGLFARSEALRDVAVANALPIVCGGQGESDLIHAGAKDFIDLALPRGRTFGADRQKGLAPFCVPHKAEAN